MKVQPPPFSPKELALLNTVINATIGSRPMSPQDADDFRQTVYLRLVERRGDFFSRFRGDSSLRTYLFVVVGRMRLDWQNHHYGKWQPTLAARKAGPVGIVLDRLLNRDGCTVDEAIEHLRCRRLPVDDGQVRRLAAALPARRRTQIVPAEFSERSQVVEFQDPVEARQRARAMRAHRTALRNALTQLSHSDRTLIRLRFVERLSVHSLAARTRTDSKALYRRFERIMRRLRRGLTAQGVDANSVQITW